MSRGANLSILGLYYNDSSIWDLMQFPEEFTDEQKQTTINSIMAECAELEILYPNPTVMKNMIGLWSKKEIPYWSRIYKASLLEYNPIENYRRNETESIEDDRTEQHSGSDTSTASGSDSTTGSSTSRDTNSGTDVTQNDITGYDSDTLVPHDKSSMTHGLVTDNTASGTNTQSYGRVDTMQHGEKIQHQGGTERTVLAYGNIGVTTSQQMLTEEFNVAKLVQVIPIIIESFQERFCLMVY